jgi:hypothetical protein
MAGGALADDRVAALQGVLQEVRCVCRAARLYSQSLGGPAQDVGLPMLLGGAQLEQVWQAHADVPEPQEDSRLVQVSRREVTLVGADPVRAQDALVLPMT